MSVDESPQGLAGLKPNYIIVGGGSAGCVMANRLSADPSVTVVLLEAGRDFLPGREPMRIRDSGMRAHFDPTLFWPDVFVENTGLLPDGRTGPIVPFMQARVMGGGSTINGMHAQRGSPDDYNEWRGLGVDGWTWNDVLPFFKRLETDRDFQGPNHGVSGPVEIQRIDEREWGPFAHGFRATLEKHGIPRLQDVNGEVGDGVGAVPLNIRHDIRVSAASAYLTPEVRQRPNLHIIGGAHVLRVKTRGQQVVGVVFERHGLRESLDSAEVVLSCGALHSPSMLLRSGIGPGEALRASGIDVVADRPGIGKNLQNHPMLIISAHLRKAGRRPAHLRPPCVMLARYSSRVADCPNADMLINLYDRSFALGWNPLGRQVAHIMLIVNKAYSRGDVRLNESDPTGPAQVRLNLLHNRLDRDRMTAGMRLVTNLLSESPAAALVDDVFLAQPTAANAILFQDSLKAKMFGAAAAFGLSGPERLRRRLLGNGVTHTSTLRDVAAMDGAVLSHVLGGGHLTGTCRMGRLADCEAVTDSRCRVIGIHGLRVVDASIFPTLMTAGTNLPAMMAAEKAAAMAIEEQRAAHTSRPISPMSRQAIPCKPPWTTTSI